MSDFLVVEENLRTAMRFFGEASGSGEVRALDGSVAVFSGLDYGVFNIGLLTRGVRGNTSELESRLAELAHFFGARTLRWSFWLCEDLLDTPARRRERQTFTSFGMRAISHPPGMMAPTLLDPVRELPAIEMRRVTDGPTRAAFAEITSVAFEIPHMVARAVYSRAEAWNGSYEGFVGMVNGRAVAIVAIVVEAGAMGVYSLATMPEFRRMGYGEALLRCATAEIRARTGLTRLVLQSTEAGYKLYRRMGFHDVTKFSVYLTK
jgi:ribosomal protein S18 acetylase RimI-like enzyme